MGSACCKRKNVEAIKDPDRDPPSMLDRLPTELILHLLYFVAFQDRDALLDVRPDARHSYIIRLKLQYRPSLRRVVRVLGYMATRAHSVQMKWVRFSHLAYCPVSFSILKMPDADRSVRPATNRMGQKNSNQITISRAGDFWRASIVTGTNIRWLETAIGGQKVPGSRVYYHSPDNGSRICKYVCQDSDYGDYKGLPTRPLPFHSVDLVCNKGGTIDQILNVFQTLSDGEHIKLTSHETPISIPKNKPVRLKIQDGIAEPHPHFWPSA